MNLTPSIRKRWIHPLTTLKAGFERDSASEVDR
jgi:hypothetical protein